MAARMRKTHQEDRFYVYRFVDENGDVAYVGKGCGRRFSVQFSRFDMTGDIVSWHAKEDDAYKEERRLIAELRPYLNKCSGGNGSRATPAKKVRERRDSFYALCDKIGTRAVAARILLGYSYLFSASKVE